MTKAIICGADFGQADFLYTMDELENLAHACNLDVSSRVTQKLDKPIAATYIGKGKAEEISRLALANAASILIINDELTPIQIRNLHQITNLDVIDRTELILQIFASRAQSKEAKIQVQIAQLRVRLPRLHTDNNVKLDQQTGGGGGSFNSRGAGETQLEKDRRVIGKKISFLKKELKEIEAKQELTRKQRAKSSLKSVALVGYTNAGKSTTLNGLLALCQQDDQKQVFEKDMLFATLDTSVRRLNFKDHRDFLVSDTVGFVSHLPHQLVQAFKTTLKEAALADLLVQVVDVSDPNYPDMIKTTEDTLKEIGVTDIPMIYAFNKADKTELVFPEIIGDQITYSARDEASIAKLVELIKQKLFADQKKAVFKIPFNQGKVLDELNVKGHVLKIDYDAEGTLISAEVSPSLYQKFERFVLEA